MNSSATTAVWRLLGDLETLIKEETLAIKKFNFDIIETIINKKDSIIQALVDASHKSGINRKTNPEFNDRMRLILETQQTNADTLNGNMEKVQRELEKTTQTKSRVKGIKGTYGNHYSGHKVAKANYQA